MTITFKAKTQDAFVIKILFELLQNNLRTACIELSQEGIKMRMTDYNRHILIDLNLSNENFAIYKCKPEKFYIGVNLSHVHKMLKTIKKKDNITMFIDDEEPNSLCITVEPKEIVVFPIITLLFAKPLLGIVTEAVTGLVLLAYI